MIISILLLLLLSSSFIIIIKTAPICMAFVQLAISVINV